MTPEPLEDPCQGLLEEAAAGSGKALDGFTLLQACVWLGWSPTPGWSPRLVQGISPKGLPKAWPRYRIRTRRRCQTSSLKAGWGREREIRERSCIYVPSFRAQTVSVTVRYGPAHASSVRRQLQVYREHSGRPDGCSTEAVFPFQILSLDRSGHR